MPGTGRGGGGDHTLNFFQALQDTEEDINPQDKMMEIDISHITQSNDDTMVDPALVVQIRHDEDNSVASIDTEMTSNRGESGVTLAQNPAVSETAAEESNPAPMTDPLSASEGENGAEMSNTTSQILPNYKRPLITPT